MYFTNVNRQHVQVTEKQQRESEDYQNTSGQITAKKQRIIFDAGKGICSHFGLVVLNLLNEGCFLNMR